MSDRPKQPSKLDKFAPETQFSMHILALQNALPQSDWPKAIGNLELAHGALFQFPLWTTPDNDYSPERYKVVLNKTIQAINALLNHPTLPNGTSAEIAHSQEYLTFVWSFLLLVGKVILAPRFKFFPDAAMLPISEEEAYLLGTKARVYGTKTALKTLILSKLPMLKSPTLDDETVNDIALETLALLNLYLRGEQSQDASNDELGYEV